MTLQEFVHEIPAIRDEAKAITGDELTPARLTWGDTTRYEDPDLPAHVLFLFQLLLSDNPTKYLKANTPEKD